MRTALVTAAAFAVLAAPARGDIQLIEPASGAATTLVKDDFTRLIGRVGDGLLVENARTGARMRVGLDGSTTPAPEFNRADEIGPGGQMISSLVDGFELRAPDGRVVGTYRRPDTIFFDPQVAWSADGSRVAVLDDGLLQVVDTTSGAELVRATVEGRLGPQAFSPDGASLVYTDDERALRMDLATRSATRLAQRVSAASWSAGGRIALTRETSIVVLGSAGVRADLDASYAARWSPDGLRLAFASERSQGACSYPLVGVGVAEPGGSPRTLVEPSTRELRGLAWAADGRLAVDRERDFSSNASQRGKRHPWPKRVANRFFIHQRGGNTAVRRVLLRVARSLKAGAEREPVLARMRRDMAPVQDRYDEIEDSIVRDAIAEELDRWLHAAGFEPVEAGDEFMC